MYCEYCGKEINSNDKYCQNCGAELKSAPVVNEPISEAKQETKKKKKMSPGKIILIVFLVSALIVGLFIGGSYALFSVVKKDLDIDYKDFYNGNFDEDDIERYFEKRFGFDDDEFDFDIDDFNEYGEEDLFPGSFNNISGNYKGVSTFKAGKINRDNNTYSSEFNGLDFQLPTGYEIYSEKKLDNLYEKQYVPAGLVESKLYLYDIYAENNLNGSTFYISYFNKDYFSDEYDNFNDFLDDIKDASEDYDDYGYTVTFAKDSKITLDGSEYTMIAARITNEAGKEYYQYDFVREIDGYYAQVSLFTESLDDVGEIIDLINAKGND